MSHPPGRRQAAGFSLIELIVVLSILAILLGIAIPNVQDFLVNYRASAQANDLIADIAYARGEAARLGRSVRVVADGDWEDGWFVGIDIDGNGSVAGANEILRQHGPVEEDYRLIEGSDALSLTFGPMGDLTAPATLKAEFAICQPEGFNHHRAVIVNAIGRASIRKWNYTANNFGNDEAGNPVDVSCS